MLKDMDNLLRMEKISKSFPGVKALDSVHFELKRGEVHAIAGENGAGKSTFMKVLTGIYKQDEGEIYYKGNLFLPENPKHAQEMGISIIHQELNLLPDLSVANNIYISREPRKVRGIIDDKEMNEKAQALLDSMGLSINAQTEVKDLKKIFDNVSFSVRSGEVLGIAGLVGAGRTEIARAIIGADRATSGEVWLKGEKCSIKAPIDAIRHGITYLPEDRKDTGLFLDQSVTFNMVAATFSDWAKQGIVNDRIIKKLLMKK